MAEHSRFSDAASCNRLATLAALFPNELTGFADLWRYCLWCIERWGPPPHWTGTDCDCLKIALDRRLVDPGATIDVTATVDFSGDPHFVGKLAVEIFGKQDGSSVFYLTAKINVRTESRVTQR